MSVRPFSREALLHVVKTLPAAPQILAQLGGLLLDINSDLDDLVKLINRDAALTARIIRISNSPLYNVGAPFASLEEALARVGFKEVYRLTGFAAMAQISEKKLLFYNWSSVQMRENSLLTALMAENLAEGSRMDPRMAYTAGLLRSTGKIALDRLAKAPSPADVHEAHKTLGLAAWEMNCVATTNYEAAATILQEWRFPTSIISGIRDHYLIENKNASALAVLLNIAGGAAERAGYGLTGETKYFSPAPWKYALVGLTETMIAEGSVRALEAFNQVRSAVG